MADQSTARGDEQQRGKQGGPAQRGQNRGGGNNRFQNNRNNNRDDDGGGFNRKGGGGQFRPRRKVCAFCTDKTKTIDWKDGGSLRRFVDDNGSIRARRKTGTCAKHQRRLAIAVKRARYLALLPFTGEHVRLARKN